MIQDLFGNPIPINKEVHTPKKTQRSRVADLILNKFDILENLSYTDDPIPIPIVNRVTNIEIPKTLITFSKSIGSKNYNQFVHFYEPDVNFVRFLHNPKAYIDHLRKFKGFIGPDFSQKVGYQPFVCFENSWWNKALTAFGQQEGLLGISNVTWSTPSSFSYAFAGIPTKSVISINCSGIKSSHASIYLWRKGYDECIKRLEPTLILRYGDKMPGEHEAISVYFENTNLKNLRYGKQRISC